ncbi:DUF2247 family protein [Neisseria wadsworthii]|uniref:DUF2247 domain-containing protein n=1 Tax=Neisseria wadsworthii 9715 TaxID=1030841 RepID=G4CP07_9NEIS|nr:DUF2247 family protein [Neisseria wadsworthii]EGZ48521.1 hypothetical protein HMPREF9370_0816 [Neisseria wadsworthii 9715]
MDYLTNDLIGLSWDDIKFGYHNQYLGWHDIVNFAKANLKNFPENDLIDELAFLTKCNAFKVGIILERLSPNFNYDDYDKGKWLYIILKKVYESKDSFDDPLEEVEKIYADFDYPEEIESFVRYMSIHDNGGDEFLLQSKEDYIQRIYNNWAKYLEDKQV